MSLPTRAPLNTGCPQHKVSQQSRAELVFRGPERLTRPAEAGLGREPGFSAKGFFSKSCSSPVPGPGDGSGWCCGGHHQEAQGTHTYAACLRMGARGSRKRNGLEAPPRKKDAQQISWSRRGAGAPRGPAIQPLPPRVQEERGKAQREGHSTGAVPSRVT